MRPVEIAVTLCALCAQVYCQDWWGNLSNPAYAHEGWSTKDSYIVVENGTCYLFFSAFYPNHGTASHVAATAARDCRSWGEPYLLLDGKAGGWKGMCSPSVKRHPQGGWVLAYNSWGDKSGQPNQLFYRLSADLIKWSDEHPLAADVTAGERYIDADVVWVPSAGRWALMAKKDQSPRMFLSAGASLDSPWDRVEDLMFTDAGGVVHTGALENWDMFVDSEGRWRVLATDIPGGHLPVLYTQSGSGKGNMTGHWVNGTVLNLPQQAFNTHDRANAAAIFTGLQPGTGEYLMTYAGSTESSSFKGRGNNKVGLARSTDLYTWEPAGE